MIMLNNYPKNKDKYLRLIEFLKEVLIICNEINISPILDGSLAVFAYTRNRNIEINDVDMSISEVKYPLIIKALEEKGVSYKLRDWHVLEVIKDGMKIGFGSSEYWTKYLSTDYETLLIDEFQIQMLSLAGLIELYKNAIQDRSKKAKKDANERLKYLALKVKYEMLMGIK